MIRVFWLPALLIYFCSLANCGTSHKSVSAVRITDPIVLNGKLSEPQWQDAPAVLDFTQFDPVEGALPTEVTSVRLLYDDNALYVGVICYDSNPSEIVQQLTRRDRISEADRFSVQIDSYHDHQTAFLFSTNVAGVQTDGVFSQDGNVFDVSWDAVWNVKTTWFRDGWAAEFEIPFNALRFSEKSDGSYEWGINFRRYISRKRETDEWVMVPRSETVGGSSLISRWGHLNGIRDIKPPLNLSFIPYVSSTATFESASAVRPSLSDYMALAGVDLKYGLTRSFTVDATVNPDFGQVEVDRAVLNLTVFETHFPEKRPFFIEGAHFFEFGKALDNISLPLFFSRRIGKRPSGSFAVLPPPGGAVESNPVATTILGAGKITGQTPSGFFVGVLTSITDEERATVRDSGGGRTEVLTEPRASYNVVRLKQDLHQSSWIGGMLTLAARQQMLPAFSAGVDWNLRFGGGAHTFDGFLAGVQSSSSTRKREGLAGKLFLSRFAAEHWLYTTSYDFYSPNFDINDLGFFAQPRDHGGYTEVGYQENFGTGLYRRYSVRVLPEYRWNWEGVRTRSVINAQLQGEFRNFWISSLLYSFSLPSFVDADRGIIGIYERPAAHAFALHIQTDQRKSLSLALSGGYEFDRREKTAFYASVRINARPASWLELTPSLFVRKTIREETGILNRGRIETAMLGVSEFSVFADRDFDEWDLNLRGTVTFTRTLSLQFFTQVLLARGKYDNHRLLVGRKDFVALASPAGAFNFNQVVLNANVLLRWEYLPGSTVYLVWTQGRFGHSARYQTSFGDRFSDAFTLPHEDVLVLKVSYWLPL